MNFSPQIFTGGNIFLDGIGNVGLLKSIDMPKLENETLEISGAIGKAELVLPSLKPLSVKFEIQALNPVVIQLCSGVLIKTVNVKLNASQAGIVQTNSKVEGIFIGAAKSTELPKYEINGEVSFSVEMSVYSFTLMLENVPVIVYDFENGIYTVNGIDQLAAIRANIN
ncbi:phage major tail tube protein [Helicobacter sp. 11S02629-2]|uniref:phage major tail tube protein n=1 Tax=Helicobacter sp. 11S02629-2 TaxID=1476195 RepID=UPI000BA73ED3|nr:phage major tail tube protein [Helicobacter sp. 11S02629-2]PAF44166.1 hypothetical protein BKH40_06105 [Helicobacter sp. 11S02629-2]